jgi:hypothetical protein
MPASSPSRALFRSFIFAHSTPPQLCRGKSLLISIEKHLSVYPSFSFIPNQNAKINRKRVFFSLPKHLECFLFLLRMKYFPRPLEASSAQNILVANRSSVHFKFSSLRPRDSGPEKLAEVNGRP